MTGNLSRQWAIVRLLANSETGLTRRQLSERFGAHEKSIRRDLNAIKAAGFDLVCIGRGPHGRKFWRITSVMIPPPESPESGE